MIYFVLYFKLGEFEYVSQSELGVKFGKAYLASEEDVDEYLDALKKALVKAIKSNRRIRL